MKKIVENAINRTATSKKVNVESLKNSGISRDILVLRKGDKISIPEDLEVRVDMFTPKGSDKASEFYTIAVEINGVGYDATMASFRRTRSATDEALDELLSNDIIRTLHNLGDDEQRAAYLRGKDLVVDEIKIVPDRFREGKTVRIPMWSMR